MSVRARVERWALEIGDAHVVGVARLAIGVLLFLQTLEDARALEDKGFFGDAFHLPFLPEAWLPSRSAFSVILAVRVLLAVLVAVGHRARLALAGSALLGLYVLLCDRVSFHHNRYALLCFAFLLAFTPCERALVITSGPRDDRRGPLWAQRLAQLQMSIIYLASGGSKLLDPDWRDGLVLGDRFARYGGEAVARGVPPRLVALFSEPLATSALAKAAIATELALAFALWPKRTRVFALWWGLMFHLTIEITSKVELFTWLTLTVYLLFVTPDVHARTLFYDPSRASGRFAARAVWLLDWLLRFEIRPWEPDALKKGHAVVVVRRDGTRATGVRAIAMFARCVPAFFPFWAPLAFVASFTKHGEASSGA